LRGEFAVIRELREKSIKYEKERERYAKIAERLAVVKRECYEKKDRFEKEELDVEKLEKNTLSSWIKHITGKFDESLKREREEAIRAKFEYDRIKNERDRLQIELYGCGENLKNLETANTEYKKAIEKLKSQLINSDEMEIYFSKLNNLENHKRELIEAIEAARKVEMSLNGAKECLKSAKNWGTYDMLGGGLIATSIKHDRIDSAKSALEAVEYNVKNLKRELKDLDEDFSARIDISHCLKMADFFWDTIFVDMSVQEHIKDGLNQVDSSLYKIDKLINDLKSEIVDCKKAQDKTEKRLEEAMIAKIEE
jgi:tetratricopeptide (TPR) repeat protein